MPMCCVELTRRALLIEPLCGFGRPANERKSTTCGILQDNEVAVPRGGVNCLAHEYPALNVSWRPSASRGVGLQQHILACQNFGPALPHPRRADEVELPRLAPRAEPWPPLRRVRRRPPTSPLARSSVVKSDPLIPRLPLCGLWRRGIGNEPSAREGTEGSWPTLFSHDLAGPRPDQRDCCARGYAQSAKPQ